MSAPLITFEPVRHLFWFRVRVARPGVAPFSYKARAANSFDAQIAAIDRLSKADDFTPASVTATLTHGPVHRVK